MKDIYNKILGTSLPEEGKYKAELVSDSLQHRVGIDSQGYLSLFIKSNCHPEDTRPSLSTKYITVFFNAHCEIRHTQGNTVSRYSIITLRSKLDGLVDYFIAVFSDLVFHQNYNFSLDSLYDYITSLFSLFSKINAVSNKVIQGLFAEMVLIYSSNQKELLVTAWHKDPSAIFDFSLENLIVEVKSTTRPERKHTFTNSQIMFLRENHSLVASVLVLESDLGHSVIELANSIRNELTTFENRNKLDKIIITTVGSSLEKMEDSRFDLEYSVNSIQLYESKSLPFLDPAIIHSYITKVRYDVDFTSMQTTNFSFT